MQWGTIAYFIKVSLIRLVPQPNGGTFFNIMKKTRRKAFNFLRSYYDVYNKLQNDEDKVQYIELIFNKMFHDIDPDNNLSFVVDLAYESQRHQIEQSVSGYKSKTKDPMEGGCQGGTQTPAIQEEEKEEEKEKKKYNIVDRKNKFFLSLTDLVNENFNDIPQQVIQDFFEYWTEHGERDRKMRFEKEKSFSLSLRFGRWLKNREKWKKEKKFAPKKESLDVADYIRQKNGL